MTQNANRNTSNEPERRNQKERLPGTEGRRDREIQELKITNEQKKKKIETQKIKKEQRKREKRNKTAKKTSKGSARERHIHMIKNRTNIPNGANLILVIKVKRQSKGRLRHDKTCNKKCESVTYVKSLF